MKVLFMFFAFLNVAFFTWQADVFNLRGPVHATKAMKVDPNIPKLALLNEPADSATSSGSAKPEPTPPPKPEPKPRPKPKTQVAKANPALNSTNGQPICYALGPFDGLPQAKNISEKLQDLGAFTSERSVTIETPMGYWVYLPSYHSWKDAKDKINDLEKKGLKDLFIVGRGSMKNAVSLGLFKNEDSAKDRVNFLKKMGETPKIETQFKQQDQYWIDIDVEPGKDQVVATIEKIAQSLTVLELNPRNCE
jgi:hypothetical protein